MIIFVDRSLPGFVKEYIFSTPSRNQTFAVELMQRVAWNADRNFYQERKFCALRNPLVIVQTLRYQKDLKQWKRLSVVIKFPHIQVPCCVSNLTFTACWSERNFREVLASDVCSELRFSWFLQLLKAIFGIVFHIWLQLLYSTSCQSHFSFIVSTFFTTDSFQMGLCWLWRRHCLSSPSKSRQSFRGWASSVFRWNGEKGEPDSMRSQKRTIWMSWSWSFVHKL